MHLTADASGRAQAFGDLRTLYTGSKHRGLLLVAYFDLRAAVSALTTLQGTLIKTTPISIRYAPARPTAGGQDSGVNQVRYQAVAAVPIVWSVGSSSSCVAWV